MCIYIYTYLYIYIYNVHVHIAEAAQGNEFSYHMILGLRVVAMMIIMQTELNNGNYDNDDNIIICYDIYTTTNDNIPTT